MAENEGTKTEAAPLNPKSFSDVRMAEREKVNERAQKHLVDSGERNPDLQSSEKAPDSGQEKKLPVEEKAPDQKPEAKAKAEPEKKAPAAADEKKEEKTVPLAALHEAREEMKSLKNDNKELQEQVKVLLKDLRELSEKPKGEETKPEDEEFLTDEQKKLRTLENEIKELREKDKQRDQLTEAEKTKRGQETLKAQLAETNLALEKDGFKGFSKFMPMVVAELQRLAADDREAAAKLDNPEGWKKIFKESVFPEVTSLNGDKSKQDKTKEKEDLKTGASLLQPGSSAAASKEDSEDDYSYDQYMKDRVKRSPQAQNPRGR